MILPFMEQESITENLIDFSSRIIDKRNDKVRVYMVPGYRCASDIGTDTFELLAAGGGVTLTTIATANYVGCFGTGETAACESMPIGQICRGSGVFYHLSRTRFDDVRDGLSQTVFVGEHGSQALPSTWVGVIPGAESPVARILGTPSTFGSEHPRGANYLFGDGTVRFVSQAIDPALVTRSRGDQATHP
jgi:prepilin-type processing-associated H-X9-DG protein